MSKKLDLTGRVVGLLTVTAPAPKRGGRTRWRCSCQCGGVTTLDTGVLTSGRTRSCGCLPRGHPPFSIVVGQRFGQLTVVEVLPTVRGKRRLCRCQCDCGGEKRVVGQYLLRGATRSCGCIGKGAGGFVKGKPTLTYSSWNNMIGRCYHPGNGSFRYYGTRGVQVCDRWRYGDGTQGGFECFLADMSERPTRGHSIDRCDGSGNYEPTNCRWATRSEQARNQRHRRTYRFRGRDMLLTEIATECGMPYERLRHRLARAGWSLRDALIAPVKKGVRRELASAPHRRETR